MLPTKRRQRTSNEINASSMADIAFLLLVFFLVTTTIDSDKGILVKLPYWDPDITPAILMDRNVFSIKANLHNELLVEGEMAEVEHLKERIKKFIINPLQDENLSTNPKNAIISLQNDRGTSYKTYLSIYNEIKAAYNELWEEESQKRYAKPFERLPLAFQSEIKDKIPCVISEAEPSEF